MKIKSFNLLDYGRNGMVAIFEEQNLHDTITVKDEIKKKRKIPIPVPLRIKINTIKYYFLILTGHWIDEWDNYLKNDKIIEKDVDKDTTMKWDYRAVVRLFDNTTITGISVNDGAFTISGEVKTLGDKMIMVTTPACGLDDDEDFPYYDDAINKIYDIFSSVKEYLQNKQFLKQDPKQYLLELTTNQTEKERISSLTEKDAEMEQLRQLEKKGVIMIMSDMREAMNLDGDNDIPETESDEDEKTVVFQAKEVPVPVKEPEKEKENKKKTTTIPVKQKEIVSEEW